MLIDSSQIQCFLAVSRHLNFTKAANEMYISQPVLSRKVAKLEEEIGIILIKRTNRALELTEAGIKLRDFFENCSGEFIETLNELTGNDLCSNYKLHIGVCEGLDLSEFFREMFLKYKNIYKNADVIIDSCTSIDIITGLKAGKYNAVVMLNSTIDSYLKYGIINKAEVNHIKYAKKCVAFSKNNPLFGNKNLSIIDFENQVLFCLKKEHIPQKVIEHSELLKKYGISPKIKLFTNMDTLTMALEMGGGYAILDTSERAVNSKDIVYFELDENNIISIVTLLNPPEWVRRFVEISKK